MGSALAPLDGVGDDVLGRIVARVRELEPETVAILVSGSYAKGVADERSDLDLQVATAQAPVAPYRMWFEERPGRAALHVSASVKQLEEWLAKREEPQDWALGLPVEHVVRYVWAIDEARAALGDPPTVLHPPADPELEDFVEAVAKVRRFAALADAVGVRLHAREAAALAPGLLRALNPDVRVRSPRDAAEAALALPHAPEHYRADLPVALGLVDASDDAVVEATLRLARELLAFLRSHHADVDPQPDIARYLADGTLERHLGFGD